MSIRFKTFFFVLLLTACSVEVNREFSTEIKETKFSDFDLNSPCPDRIYSSLKDQANLIKRYDISERRIMEIIEGDSVPKEDRQYQNGACIMEVRYQEGSLNYYFHNEVNENGKTLIRKTFDSDSNKVGSLHYAYDNNGNRIEYYQILKDNSKVNHQFRVFNEQNQNTELYELHADKKWLTKKYEYCESGALVKTISYMLDGNEEYNSKTNYDSLGNYQQTVTYYPEGEVDYSNLTLYEYDERSRIISKLTPKELSLAFNDSTMSVDFSKRIEYSYFDNGLLHIKKTIMEDKIVEELVYSYK